VKKHANAFNKKGARKLRNLTEGVAGIVVAAAGPLVGAEVLLGADAAAAAPTASATGHWRGEGKGRWRRVE